MKIEKIRIAGFRGFRRPIEFRIPSGFLIVTGRNGAGKSTICDAIEYALTGSIERYGAAKETRESIADYLWWRGDEPADMGYVELELRRDDSDEVTQIRRDRTGKFDIKCLDGLCSAGESPTDSIAQLCRTSIIRDDTIGKFSFELSETERFGFVEAAVGSGDLQRYDSLLQTCVSQLGTRFAHAQDDFTASTQEVVRLREELSSAQARLPPSAEVIRAESRLREIIQSDDMAVTELLLAAERTQSNLRRREQQLLELLRRFDASHNLRQGRAQHEAALQHAQLNLDALTSAHESAERRMAELAEARRHAADDAPVIAALARLQAAGAELGLQDGHCPLCHSAVQPEDFGARLNSLKQTIEKQSENLNELESQYSTITKELALLQVDEAAAKRLVAISQTELTRVDEASNVVTVAAVEAGFDAASLSRQAIEQEISSVRTNIGELQAATATLEAQASLERISDLFNAIASAQRTADQLFAASQEIAAAKNRATEALHAVRTLAGRITQERLGSISPLLSDLYLRIRPHSDWRQVQYRLRGEVRRFLSLLVGPELNPRFVFSSGQRRAAGLAFLLAVHLSRAWCQLETLILDDPVQHIDDFRALQLIEVLSAIRQADGRQVICTVENPELAVVMARRLRSSHTAPGTILRLQPTAGGDAMLTYEDVPPASAFVTAYEQPRSG
jgi:chromosome segregation protein